jgi:hypothetical protein
MGHVDRQPSWVKREIVPVSVSKRRRWFDSALEGFPRYPTRELCCGNFDISISSPEAIGLFQTPPPESRGSPVIKGGPRRSLSRQATTPSLDGLGCGTVGGHDMTC